ncbi:cytoglobin-1 [Microcaecilia unicolor]|uniref:Cytoglobin-1-like n=1 Tax=Microcaecilia unicolor TaxID=1415580 RepID=A0A6P7ZJ01_9AMPH|nr:cytoglobin-1-like [Microcaecilia unicolor]
MGCALSGLGVEPAKEVPDGLGSAAKNRSSWKAEEEGSKATKPRTLSEAQKLLIQDSWRSLHQDITRVGIIMFIRLFETHPECKDAFFLFREIEDLQDLKMSKQLQAHGLRVMSFIEKSVARLTQEDKLEQLATDLGRSHYKYSAPPKYYQYVGVQFIGAVKPFLKDRWTLEVEEAWEGLFAYITTLMKKGYQEAERGCGMNKSTDPEKTETSSIGSIQNSV